MDKLQSLNFQRFPYKPSQKNLKNLHSPFQQLRNAKAFYRVAMNRKAMYDHFFTLMGARKRSRMLTANTNVSGYSCNFPWSSVNQRTASSRWAGEMSVSCNTTRSVNRLLVWIFYDPDLLQLYMICRCRNTSEKIGTCV